MTWLDGGSSYDCRIAFAGHATMITVHYLNNSRSQRALWALNDLRLSCEGLRYGRDPLTMPPAAYQRALERGGPFEGRPLAGQGPCT